jgi:hypothetical protein
MDCEFKMNLNVDVADNWKQNSFNGRESEMEAEKKSSHLFDFQELLVILGALLLVAAGVILILSI